jgi:hypothetical protein
MHQGLRVLLEIGEVKMSSSNGWIWFAGVAVLLAGLVGATRWLQSRKLNTGVRTAGQASGDGSEWPASRTAPDTQAGRI